MINVTVIGFGNVGSSLCTLLLNNKHSVRLNIMEPAKNQEGALLDLAHTMVLYPRKQLSINDEALFLNADFIYFTAGIPNVHGASRLSKTKENVQIVKDIFEHIIFSKAPFMIVISNPVDIISQAVYKYSGLPVNKVIGTGTFLDSIRMAHILSTLSNYEAIDFKTVVLGEHGSSQVPIYSMTKVKDQAILNHSDFSMEDLELASELTKEAAYQIRLTQKGTKYGVSKCAAVLMDYLLKNKEEEHLLSLSMLTNDHFRSLLELENDIFIGLPALIKGGEIKLLHKVDLSAQELKDLRKSASVLAKHIQKELD